MISNLNKGSSITSTRIHPFFSLFSLSLVNAFDTTNAYWIYLQATKWFLSIWWPGGVCAVLLHYHVPMVMILCILYHIRAACHDLNSKLIYCLPVCTGTAVHHQRSHTFLNLVLVPILYTLMRCRIDAPTLDALQRDTSLPV